MNTAHSAVDYIYQGVWTDWSKGRVLGSTLTVSSTHAAILSPAIAIIIQIAGAQLWRLFQFVLHQIRATYSKRDLLYHQQQVALRNSSTDLNTIWRLFRLGFAWRHQKDIRAFARTFFLVFWTFVHFVAVITFSLMSTSLLSAGDQVLSRSPWCGTWTSTYVQELQGTNDSDARIQMEYGNYFNAKYASVQQYVDLRSSVLGQAYQTLPANPLGFTSITNQGGCPFGGSICNSDIDGSISLDTVYLSSQRDLGFNAPKDERVSFRLLAQCAPLDDAKYISDWKDIPATTSMPAHQAVDANYGPSRKGSRNFTYSYSNYRNLMECDQRANTPPYILDSEFIAAAGGGQTFAAIQDLKATNADTTIVFLMYNNAYEAPVSDPWFSAQQAVNDTNAFCLGTNKTVYTREKPLTTLGCTQQWQICNSDSSPGQNASGCTPPLGIAQIMKYFSAAGNANSTFTPRQRATANRIISSAVGASFYYVINALSQTTAPPLKARNMMSQLIGLPLPDDQWKTETEYWTQILLAMLQQTSLDFSTGQFTELTTNINVTRPASAYTSVSPSQAAALDAAHWLCQNQMIRSDSYRSFNFLALCFTIAICVLIIALGLFIEDIVGYIRQRSLRYTRNSGKQDMWIINSDIEMLSTLSKLQTGAVWGRSKSGIPLAQPGHEISITELQTDDLEVKKGTGIVKRKVQRTRTDLSNELQKPHSPRTEYGTSSTLTLSPIDSPSTCVGMNASPLATAPPATSANHQNMVIQKSMFQHDFQNPYNMRGNELGQLHIKVGKYSSVNGEGVKSASAVVQHEQEFVYEHSIPSDEALPVTDIPSPPANDSRRTLRHSSSTIPKPLFQRSRHDIVRPPSGWGVLPKDITTLWNRSRNHEQIQ